MSLLSRLVVSSLRRSYRVERPTVAGHTTCIYGQTYSSGGISSGTGITRSAHTKSEEDDQLHPTWSSLERRLLSRTPRERGEGVPEGRTNLKPSEEDFWHAAGAYDNGNAPSATSTILNGEAAFDQMLKDHVVGLDIRGEEDGIALIYHSMDVPASAPARLSTVSVSSENLPLVIQIYKTSISPVLQVTGFCGAQVFADSAAGKVHSLTLWESWGALETAIADPRYAEAMKKLATMIDGPPNVSDTNVACCILPTTGGGDQPGDATP